MYIHNIISLHWKYSYVLPRCALAAHHHARRSAIIPSVPMVVGNSLAVAMPTISLSISPRLIATVVYF